MSSTTRIMNLKEKQAEEAKLLAAITKELRRLEELLRSVNGHWACEDLVYRFYFPEDLPSSSLLPGRG